jgi:hypothetical protein
MREEDFSVAEKENDAPDYTSDDPRTTAQVITDQVHPNRIEEDQEMEMQPIVLGPAPYSSPDPETDGIKMLPLEEGTSGVTTPEGPEGVTVGVTTASPEEDADKRAADWKAEIESAMTQDELDAIRARYDASGADFSTVEDAFDSRSAEIPS